MNIVPVIIAGAGPTGLMLACQLCKRGIAPVIVDQAEGISIHSKALIIHASTLETLDRLGIIDSFLKEGRPIKHFAIHLGDQEVLFPAADPTNRFPFALVLSQANTERILYEYLQKLGGNVLWNTKLTSFNASTAYFQEIKTSRGFQLPFHYLVGCDGAHSTVREVLGMPFKGNTFPEKALLADIKTTFALSNATPHAFFTDQGGMIIAPFPEKGHFRLIFPTYEGKDEPSIEELVALLKRHGLSPTSPVISQWISSFHLHRRMVKHCIQGNIFLAGDAAHIHSPAGGQGMNTSIQDAENLGWKLSYVLQGRAPERLLKSYEKERLYVAAKILKGTTILTKAFLLLQKASLHPLLQKFLLLLFKSPFFQKKSGAQLSGSWIRYPHPSFNPFEKGPQAGEKYLDITLDDGKDLATILRQGVYVCLFFKKDSCASLMEKNFTDSVFCVTGSSREARKKYAARPNSVILIRPDGYLEFNLHKAKQETVFYRLSQLFMPASSNRKW